MENVWTIIVAVIGSGAVFGFIQFLISRKDKKDNKQDQILQKIDSLSDRLDMQGARIARENILRFDDELISGVKHSREYFRAILEDDVDGYEKYCRSHEDFKNSFTTEAVKHIRNVYNKLVDAGEFKPTIIEVKHDACD